VFYLKICNYTSKIKEGIIYQSILKNKQEENEIYIQKKENASHKTKSDTPRNEESEFV